MNKTAHCNDGSMVSVTGNNILAKDGTYVLTGNMLIGPRNFRSMNVNSMEEAFAMVCGIHGGKKF